MASCAKGSVIWRHELQASEGVRYALSMRKSCALILLAACASPGPEGLAPAAEGPGPKVVFDVYHRPLPEIPLPNDFATRFDGSSPTHRRINASIEAAPTRWEQHTRAELDKLSGWGTLAPITVAFDAPLDLENIVARHQAPADFADDAVYVFDVTESSPDLCKPVPLDLGQGHFPVLSTDPDYFDDDPHAGNQTLTFEGVEEDLNGNGVLDEGEDTDMDGVLDHPNVLDAAHSGPWESIGFYERETRTLIARPLYPMREATTYAVVLTNRLTDASGHPVRSPFPNINHTAQTGQLAQLSKCLSTQNLSLSDVAFTWAFSTQSTTADYKAVRDGLYGKGPMAWLSKEFPAELATLEEGRHPTNGSKNTKIVPGDQFLQLGTQLFQVYGGSQTDGTKQAFADWLKFVDFYAAGSIISPQFFPRTDRFGQMLPLYDQTFSLDPVRGDAFTRPEKVPMFIAAPKGRTGPAPVVIFVHGHGGSQLDSLLLMGPMARAGLATIGIDSVSHGIGLDETDRLLVSELVKPYGIDPLANQLTSSGRAIDWDHDGVVDSGADFFTGYVVHTRDELKQTAMDIMQMVRVLRSFDGQRRWAFDVNRDGENDLAGDFDGDGVVDIGGPNVPIHLAGASLGGIMSSLVGGVEPEFDAILPILPGGYLSEIGSRSALGQVRVPLVLRMLAPMFDVKEDSGGKPVLYETVPNVLHALDVKVASLAAPLKPGSIAVVRNLDTGEWRCGRAQPNGHLRVAVSSDDGNKLRFELYDHELPTKAPEGCDPAGATPVLTVDKFEGEVKFQGATVAANSPLVALGDGFGMRRGSPDLRRLFGLAQVALESSDPANFAPFYEGTRTLSYADGSTVSTRSLMIPMTGDPGVPIATANALMRAAGHLDFENVDPAYGVTRQQQLLNVGFVQGVYRASPYKDPAGNPVLEDVSVLESVASADDGFGAPRLNPPMRMVRDALGGKVGAMFPYMNPQGEHSFPVPDPAKQFDLGSLLINLFADYLGSGGTRVRLEPCMERNNCDWLKPVPQ